MIRKIFKVIFGAILFVVILFSGIIIYVNHVSSKYEKTAVPFIKESIPIIATWEYEKFKHLLTPKTQEVLETEKGERLLRGFSKLGPLRSLEKPQFLRAESSASFKEGSKRVLAYSVVAHFEAGEGLINLQLQEHDSSFLIQLFQIDSEVFLE